MPATTAIETSKTKAIRAARRLRAFGILAHWRQEENALVAYVTKHGEASTRAAMFRALETPCVLDAERRRGLAHKLNGFFK